MEIVIALVALVVGIVIGRLTYHREGPVGDLRVDHSDPTSPPYLFLELEPDTDVHSIMRKKRVMFRVKVKNFIPHK